MRHRSRKTWSGALSVATGGVGLLLLAGGYLWHLGGGAPPARAAPIGGPFTLTQDDGRVVTDRSYAGRYLLIFFGYTSCPDECPTTLASVADAMGRLGVLADRVQPLFITVDPRRDTPQVVRRYVAEFTPRLVGLTGTPAQIQAVSAQYEIDHTPRHGTTASPDYTIDHTVVLFLMDPDGHLVAPIAADESGKELAEDLRRYVR